MLHLFNPLAADDPDTKNIICDVESRPSSGCWYQCVNIPKKNLGEETMILEMGIVLDKFITANPLEQKHFLHSFSHNPTTTNHASLRLDLLLTNITGNQPKIIRHDGKNILLFRYIFHPRKIQNSNPYDIFDFFRFTVISTTKWVEQIYMKTRTIDRSLFGNHKSFLFNTKIIDVDNERSSRTSSNRMETNVYFMFGKLTTVFIIVENTDSKTPQIESVKVEHSRATSCSLIPHTFVQHSNRTNRNDRKHYLYLQVQEQIDPFIKITSLTSIITNYLVDSHDPFEITNCTLYSISLGLSDPFSTTVDPELVNKLHDFSYNEHIRTTIKWKFPPPLHFKFEICYKHIR